MFETIRKNIILKLLAMNHYDMEENSRPERLTEFKVAYGASLDAVRACIVKFFPDTDCEKKTACLEKARYGILVPECGGQGEEQERQEGELARAMLCLIEQKELREEYARKSLERAGQFTKEEFLSRWKAVIEGYEP